MVTVKTPINKAPIRAKPYY